MWEGHDGSRVVGIITRTWVQSGMVWAEGRFDLGNEFGREYARRLGDGMAGWVSADLSDVAVEEIPLDDAGNELDPAELQAAWQAYEEAWSKAMESDVDPDDADLPEQPPEPSNYLLRLTSWKLMGVTAVSSPAFEDARVEPVYGDADLPAVDDAEELVAAAVGDEEEHTGAMIALVPAETDAALYAVEGGDPVEQLHTTLVFLGEAADWDPEQRAALEAAVTELVASRGPLSGNTWGTALFNPTGPEPCAVYLVEAGQELVDLHDASLAAAEAAGPVAEQHAGYIPHMTAGYGIGIDTLAETGPVTFDRVRIAWAGENTDIPLGSTAPALTAAATVFAADDFTMPEPDVPTALTVTDDGRVYGHLATWGTCHIGFADTCVTPPSSGTDYRYFHQGEVSTDAGRLAVGKITLGTGHAGRNDSARAAAAHYDDTGTVAAVVRCRDGALGPWMSGRLVPGIEDRKVEELRRAGVSGDWRGIGGSLELVAALAVNVPGFPIPRTQALAASGQQISLIAAGLVAPSRPAPKPRSSSLVSFDTSGMTPDEIIRMSVRATIQEMNEEKTRAARRDAAAGVVRAARVESATRRVRQA
jgi:2'-5' RNA ligase